MISANGLPLLLSGGCVGLVRITKCRPAIGDGEIYRMSAKPELTDVLP